MAKKKITWPIWFLALNHSGSDAGLSRTCKYCLDGDGDCDEDGDVCFDKI